MFPTSLWDARIVEDSPYRSKERDDPRGEWLEPDLNRAAAWYLRSCHAPRASHRLRRLTKDRAGNALGQLQAFGTPQLACVWLHQGMSSAMSMRSPSSKTDQIAGRRRRSWQGVQTEYRFRGKPLRLVLLQADNVACGKKTRVIDRLSARSVTG